MGYYRSNDYFFGGYCWEGEVWGVYGGVVVAACYGTSLGAG